MSGKTLTYSEGVEGWPSFYSFIPEYMVGMNNYFYSFKNGNLYRHNTNERRNHFYGVDYSSVIKSVFNEQPLENKLFKTVSLEGDARWKMELVTDIQNTGHVEANWWEKKEQVFYGFIRNSGEVPAEAPEYVLRSLNGIGLSSSVSGGNVIEYPLNTNIKNIMSIGDMLYFSLPPYTSPLLAGKILTINSDIQNGVNNITIDTTILGATPISIQDAFYFYIKDAVSESHGVLGHFCVFDIENDNTTKINLFAVGSELMKSYP